MLLAFRHSLKLSLINILGFIMSYMVYGVGALILFVFILILGAGGSLLGMITTNLDDPTELLESSLAAGAMMIIGFAFVYLSLIFIACLANSIWLGGTYAYSLEASQDNYSSMGTYFSKAFSNMFKLTWMSIIYTLFVFVPVALIIVLPVAVFETFGILPSFLNFLLFGLFIIIGSLFLSAVAIHSPIFIIQERVGAWKSISLSIKLFFRSMGQVILSVLAYLASMAIITGTIYLLALLGILFTSLIHEITGNEVIPAILAVIMVVIVYILFVPLSISFPTLWISDRYNKKLRDRLFPPSNQQHKGHMHFKIQEHPSEQPFTFEDPPTSQPPKLNL